MKNKYLESRDELVTIIALLEHSSKYEKGIALANLCNAVQFRLDTKVKEEGAK